MIETIKVLRQKHNYSQTFLASYLNISRQMYIKYELGEVEPPVRIVVALAKLYKIPYDQIIDDRLNPDIEKFSYKIGQNSFSEVASPSVPYGAESKINNQLNNLISILQTMPKETIPSVYAFVKMLQTEQIHVKETFPKSKKAFFDLAGKINLSSEEITEFREASLI